MASKTTITVTSVPEDLKTRFQVACLQAGTNPSETIRQWLPRIIDTLSGASDDPDRVIIEQAETIEALREELRMSKRISRIQTRALMILDYETAREAMKQARAEIEAEDREVHSETGTGD